MGSNPDISNKTRIIGSENIGSINLNSRAIQKVFIQLSDGIYDYAGAVASNLNLVFENQNNLFDYSISSLIGLPVAPLGQVIPKRVDNVGEISVMLTGESIERRFIFQPYQIRGTCTS